MKKKTIVLSAVVTALVLSAGCVTAFAAESDGFSYLTGRQRSASRNELYTQASELPEEEQNAFLTENGIGETPWSEEAAASYSYGTQDMSGYSYLTGQQRGNSYHK